MNHPGMMIPIVPIGINLQPAMPTPKVPQPGSAKLSKNSGPDEWLKCALNNQYLPEAIMKKLCEMCKELLMEGTYTLRLHWIDLKSIRELCL